MKKLFTKELLRHFWKTWIAVPLEPDPLRDEIERQRVMAKAKQDRDALAYAEYVARARKEKGLPPL